MDDIVRLKPQSTYATVSAALTLAKGRRVALVFPEGERACLRETALLDALSARCHRLGKVAVIIGGDAWLRAHAVAAGFETATTLEDWGNTAPELRAARPRRAAHHTPHLQLVADSPQDDASAACAYGDDDASDPWDIEPPDYVIALRKAFVSPSPVMRAPVVSGSLARVLLDEDEDAIDASERFEEVITGRILETSGIHRTDLPGGAY
ncbi:MAG TPA: hypothetical protein VGF38_06800 [Ktedonobacterales bacterium]|jgi:hypothetical protein